MALFMRPVGPQAQVSVVKAAQLRNFANLDARSPLAVLVAGSKFWYL